MVNRQARQVASCIWRRYSGRVKTRPLTPRETDVLRLVAAGLTNKDIGHELGIRPGTVKEHVAHIMKKLDVPNRAAAAVRIGQVRESPKERD